MLDLNLLEALYELDKLHESQSNTVILYYTDLEVNYDNGHTYGNGYDEPIEHDYNTTTVEYEYEVDRDTVTEIIIDAMAESDYNELLNKFEQDEVKVFEYIADNAEEYLEDDKIEKTILEHFEEAARESWEESNFSSYNDDLYDAWLEDQRDSWED